MLLLATLTSFTPGPNTTLSTALAANLGLRHALRFVVAVPVGWGLLVCVCAAGVGSLVMAWPVLRLAIQSVGVGYLLWLAYKLANTRHLASADSAGLQVGFIQGVLLQFLNIKAWMLALSITGGWISGTAAGYKTLVGLCDAQTRVITANGTQVIGKAELEAEMAIIANLADQLTRMLRKGYAPADMLAAAPAKDYEAKLGDATQFLTESFKSLWPRMAPDA